MKKIEPFIGLSFFRSAVRKSSFLPAGHIQHITILHFDLPAVALHVFFDIMQVDDMRVMHAKELVFGSNSSSSFQCFAGN